MHRNKKKSHFRKPIITRKSLLGRKRSMSGWLRSTHGLLLAICTVRDQWAADAPFAQNHSLLKWNFIFWENNKKMKILLSFGTVMLFVDDRIYYCKYFNVAFGFIVTTHLPEGSNVSNYVCWFQVTCLNKMKEGMNSMANWVMRHLSGYRCYPCTGFEDQLKTLNVLEIWNDLHN